MSAAGWILVGAAWLGAAVWACAWWLERRNRRDEVAEATERVDYAMLAQATPATAEAALKRRVLDRHQRELAAGQRLDRKARALARADRVDWTSTDPETRAAYLVQAAHIILIADGMAD